LLGAYLPEAKIALLPQVVRDASHRGEYQERSKPTPGAAVARIPTGVIPLCAPFPPVSGGLRRSVFRQRFANRFLDWLFDEFLEEETPAFDHCSSP
jgi:hypothetical protein